MIRYLKKYGLLLFGLLLPCGCVRVEEEDIVRYEPKPSEEICFLAQVAGTETKGDVRHAGYLEIQEEEWPLEGVVSTKADAHDGAGALYGYFGNAGVRIFLYDDSWDSPGESIARPTPAEQALIGYQVLPALFDSEGLLSPVSTILWTSAKKEDNESYYEHLRAYSFAPLMDDPRHGKNSIHSMLLSGAASFDAGSVGSYPSITYTVPDEPEDQCDLIAGYSGEVAGDLRAVVPMTFHHVFSAVQFKLDFAQTVRVKSLTLSGVYKKGTGYIDDSGRQIVNATDDADGDGTPDEIGDDLYAYTFSFTGSGDYTEYVASDGHTVDGVLTEGDRTLMMIPQTLPEGAALTLVYQVNDSGWQTKVMTCPLGGMVWRPGYRYIYTIKETPAYDIYFDLAAEDVRITSSGYSGSVYVGGEVTAVTGSHSASNRYYVYQSTGATAGAYDKDHTGYPDAATWNGGAPLAPPTVPAYKEVMKGAETWSDYITGNSDSKAVTEAWAPAVAEAERTASSHRIVVSTSVSLTIDNVWSSNEDGFSSTATSAGSNTANTPFYISSGTVYLKGDNHFGKVYTGSDSPVTFTSYYGDGSFKGSITSTKSTDRPFGMCGHTMFGAGNGQVTRVTIKGGTYFVGQNTRYAQEDTTNDNKYKSNGCLSGGNNSDGFITITGGRVTAVAHGSCAAIGGGGGADSQGGNGTVNISGGIVYAFQYGFRTSNVAKKGVARGLRATAIGGGSTWRHSGNSGTVNITGGYVYAQSVGGNAIGGGSSEGGGGGNADITIGPGATVIARSIPGLIYGKTASIWVDAGASIGGGNGGNETYKNSTSGYRVADGGTATVTITGGRLYAGSVGGGKNGQQANGNKRLLGSAQISISGSAEVQGQFIMAAGSAVAPSYTQTGGNVALLSGTQEYKPDEEGNIQNVLHSFTDGDFYFIRPDGGAVYIETGTCTISGGSIKGFTARNGGAVWMKGGTFTMNGGVIQNCRAYYDDSSIEFGNGGAVYINDASGLAQVTLTGGTIQGNYADFNGGGIYLQGGNVDMTDAGGGCTVTGNKALDNTGTDDKGNGGGIYLSKGDFTMSAGSITGNTANRNGGGVWVSSEDTDLEVTVTGGTIATNQSERFGAGLYVVPGSGHTATVNIGANGAPYSSTNPAITGNSASLRGGAIYASGPGATINCYDGLINYNYTSAYVYNQDITNEEGGQVSMELNGGVPVPNVEYITVTIDPAGGDFTDGETAGEPVKRYLVKATNSTLSIPEPKRKHFTFVGWLPSQSEGETGYSTYTDGMVFNYDKDLTLTAQWRL